MAEAVKVAVRLRPINQKERDEKRQPIVQIREGTTVQIETPSGEAKTFTYDYAFGDDSKQVDVYNSTTRPIVESVAPSVLPMTTTLPLNCKREAYSNISR